jgi:NADP-dependent 3-hydroxy acid dehydrogenase YdfG
MNICITGHTSGLGKALFDFWSSSNNTVTGYSRSNGYDLDHDLDKFNNDQFDIFVNNAYSGFKQVELLYLLYEKNKNRNCIILNIGSASSDGNVDRIKPYAIEKLALDRAVLQLQFNSTKCKILLVKPGRMETRMASHINAKKLDLDAVVKAVDWIINQPEEVYFRSITIDNFPIE